MDDGYSTGRVREAGKIERERSDGQWANDAPISATVSSVPPNASHLWPRELEKGHLYVSR
jgi:hypothetical protein